VLSMSKEVKRRKRAWEEKIYEMCTSEGNSCMDREAIQ
jgi:hypothetical protein